MAGNWKNSNRSNWNGNSTRSNSTWQLGGNNTPPPSQYNQYVPANPNYRSGQQQTFKKSGCEYTYGEDKVPLYANGWRVSKTNGLMKFVCSMKKNGKGAGVEHVSKKGKRYLIYVAKITTNEGMSEKLTNALYCLETQNFYFPELNLIASARGFGHTRTGKVAKGFWGRVSR